MVYGQFGHLLFYHKKNSGIFQRQNRLRVTLSQYERISFLILLDFLTQMILDVLVAREHNLTLHLMRHTELLFLNLDQKISKYKKFFKFCKSSLWTGVHWDFTSLWVKFLKFIVKKDHLIQNLKNFCKAQNSKNVWFIIRSFYGWNSF